jgi:hypothetical protein
MFVVRMLFPVYGYPIAQPHWCCMLYPRVWGNGSVAERELWFNSWMELTARRACLKQYDYLAWSILYINWRASQIVPLCAPLCDWPESFLKLHVTQYLYWSFGGGFPLRNFYCFSLCCGIDLVPITFRGTWPPCTLTFLVDLYGFMSLWAECFGGQRRSSLTCAPDFKTRYFQTVDSQHQCKFNYTSSFLYSRCHKFPCKAWGKYIYIVQYTSQLR